MTPDEILKSLFKDIFEFDTHKIINQAPTYFFSDVLVEEIKKKGLTWKIINELIADKVPIFVYKTRLTLHGIISEEQIKRIKRIRGLQSCIRNGNGTLSINYNAIDLENKEEMDKILNSLYTYFGIFAPRLLCNCKGSGFHTGFEKQEPMQELFNKIKTSLFYGDKINYFESSKQYGRYKHRVHIDMKLMKPEMMWDIITNWTGITLEMYKKRIEEKKIKIALYHQNIAQAKLNRNEDDLLKKTREKENYEASIKKLTHLPVWNGKSDKLDKNIILVSGTRTEPHPGFRFVWLFKNSWEIAYYALQNNIDHLPGSPENPNPEFISFVKREWRIQDLAKSQWYVWKEEEEEKEKPVPNIEEPVEIKGLELLVYSEKCLAIFGNITPYENLLENLGGKKNQRLTYPTSDMKMPGWIFYRNQEGMLKRNLGLKITAPRLAISA